MKESLLKIKTYLLSGVSFAIPFIACGGILIAFAVAYTMTPHGPDFSNAPAFILLINDVGSASFALMLPILAGYIAYAMASRPGLVPGFVGGYLAGHLALMPNGKDWISAGFLGALVAGLLAGYIVNLIKKVKVPAVIRPIMPILIIPIISSTVVGFLMLKIIGLPIADLMTFLGTWLQSMGKGNAVLLAIILGSMIAFDMGGPVNKAAFFFGAAMIKEGNFAVMGAVAAAICTPPLGMGLATVLKRSACGARRSAKRGKPRSRWAALASPKEPSRLPHLIRFVSSRASWADQLWHRRSRCSGTLAITRRMAGPSSSGVDHRLMYVVAILAGTLVTALAINLLKSRQTKEPAA
jgi:PTS system fructose-specific IIC component